MTTFTFLLPITDLFNFCGEYTSKRIYDHKQPENNVSLVEHFSIREDDKTIFKSFLKSAAGECFANLRAAAKALTDAFEFDTAATTTPVYAGGDIMIKVDLDDSVNTIQLEDALNKTMCFYVLREWYIMKGFEQESIVPDRNYTYNLSIVKNYGQGGGVGGGAVSQNDSEGEGSTATRPHVFI